MNLTRPSAGTKYSLAKSAKSAKKTPMKRPFNLGDLCVFARGIASLFATAYRPSIELSGKNFQLLRLSSADTHGENEYPIVNHKYQMQTPQCKYRF